MSVTSQLMKKLNNDIINLQKGLQPDHLSFWYQKIILDTKEMAPPWLQDKIKVNQDELLPILSLIHISSPRD